MTPKRQPDKVTVEITLSINRGDVKAFLATWDEVVKDEFTRIGGIDKAEMVVPPATEPEVIQLDLY